MERVQDLLARAEKRLKLHEAKAKENDQQLDDLKTELSRFRQLESFVKEYGLKAKNARGKSKDDLAWYESYDINTKLVEADTLSKKSKEYDNEATNLLTEVTRAQAQVKKCTKELEAAKKPIARVATHLKGNCKTMLERSPGKLDSLILKSMKNYQVCY